MTLLFWNFLAFLLLLIVAHLFWHLGESGCGGHGGDSEDGGEDGGEDGSEDGDDDVEEEEEDF